MTDRPRPLPPKVKVKMVFVECRLPSGQYFGANYPETELPTVYALLRKQGVTTVTLDETTEVIL